MRRIPVDSSEAERAFERVGGIEEFPWPVFAEVLRDQTVHRKALVETADSRGRPVLVPLRYRPPFWEPLLTGVYPDAPIAAGPGDHLDALVTLPGPFRLRYLHVLPPRRVTWAKADSHYIADLSVNPEIHWRKGGWMDGIRLNRNRMKSYSLDFDRPGDAEWMFSTWYARWGHMPVSDAVNWRERAAAHRHFAALGRASTLAIEGQDGIVAACSTFRRGDDVWYWTTIRRPGETRRVSPGNLLIDTLMMRAYRDGHRTISLGTMFEYKRHWAPAGAPLWLATAASPAARVRLAVRRAPEYATQAARRVARRPGAPASSTGGPE
ncbi:MAG: GNAT family N-acetyltransferase [Dehalococcoidia bacterium]